jgi:hypothetical protein
MRVIYIRDMTFNYSLFYDPAELDISHIFTVNIKNTVKILDVSAPFYPAFRDIIEEDKTEFIRDTIKVNSDPVSRVITEGT